MKPAFKSKVSVPASKESVLSELQKEKARIMQEMKARELEKTKRTQQTREQARPIVRERSPPPAPPTASVVKRPKTEQKSFSEIMKEAEMRSKQKLEEEKSMNSDKNNNKSSLSSMTIKRKPTDSDQKSSIPTKKPKFEEIHEKRIEKPHQIPLKSINSTNKSINNQKPRESTQKPIKSGIIAQSNQSSLNNKSINSSAINNKSINQSSINKSINSSSINNKSINQSSINNKSINQSSINNKSINQSSINNRTINQSSINNRTINQSSINNRTINQSSINNRTINQTSNNNRAVNPSSINNRSTNQSSINSKSIAPTSSNNIRTINSINRPKPSEIDTNRLKKESNISNNEKSNDKNKSYNNNKISNSNYNHNNKEQLSSNSKINNSINNKSKPLASSHSASLPKGKGICAQNSARTQISRAPLQKPSFDFAPPPRGIAAQNSSARGIMAQSSAGRLAGGNNRYSAIDQSESDYSDEYDSDFIDDTEDVGDVDKIKKEIYKSLNYDPSKYDKVNPYDDCKNMESRFTDIAKEELRSSRIAREEDLREFREQERLKEKKYQKKMK